MSLLSFLSSKKESLIAIVDIGSSSVGVALLESRFDKKSGRLSKIIHTVRTEIQLETKYDFRRYLAEITMALRQSLEAILLAKLGVPEKYVCFLASPFYVSQTKVIKYEAEAGFIFTPKLLDSLTAQELARFLSYHAEIYTSLINGDFFALENKTMRIKLNGYEVNQPFGQKATKVELAFYVSGSSTSLIEHFREEIIKTTSRQGIEFHSFAFAAGSALRDILDHQTSFLIVDPGGELTDVAVVMEDILTENLSFPLGQNSLIRQVALNLSTVYAEAESQLNSRLTAGPDKKADDPLDKVLFKIKNDWLAKMHEILNSILKNGFLPEQVYFLGDGAITRFFADWMAGGDFRDFTMSSRPLQIKYLNSTSFNPDLSYEKSTRDIFLLLESVFYDKIN